MAKLICGVELPSGGTCPNRTVPGSTRCRLHGGKTLSAVQGEPEYTEPTAGAKGTQGGIQMTVLRDDLYADVTTEDWHLSRDVSLDEALMILQWCKVRYNLILDTPDLAPRMKQGLEMFGYGLPILVGLAYDLLKRVVELTPDYEELAKLPTGLNMAAQVPISAELNKELQDIIAQQEEAMRKHKESTEQSS